MTGEPVCTTMAECTAHDGERVQVVGTYTVWDPMPDRPENLPQPQQVMIKFASEDGPFLGAWGYADHFRSLAEIERFRGTPVRVTGTFLRSMPPHPTDPPEAASMAGPCLHPVESITAEAKL